MLDAEHSHARRAATDPLAAAEEISLPAEDGRSLAATLFMPPAVAPPAVALTIVAGGTGIPRRYYARFAASTTTASSAPNTRRRCGLPRWSGLTVDGGQTPRV